MFSHFSPTSTSTWFSWRDPMRRGVESSIEKSCGHFNSTHHRHQRVDFAAPPPASAPSEPTANDQPPPPPPSCSEGGADQLMSGSCAAHQAQMAIDHSPAGSATYNLEPKKSVEMTKASALSPYYGKAMDDSQTLDDVCRAHPYFMHRFTSLVH